MREGLRGRILPEQSLELFEEVRVSTHMLPADYQQTIGWNLLDLFLCFRLIITLYAVWDLLLLLWFYNDGGVVRRQIVGFWREARCQSVLLVFTKGEVVLDKEAGQSLRRLQHTEVMIRVEISCR